MENILLSQKFQVRSERITLEELYEYIRKFTYA